MMFRSIHHAVFYILHQITYRIRSRKKLYALVLGCIVLYCYLLSSHEKQYAQYEGPCPEIVWSLDATGLSVEDGYYYDPSKVLQCEKIVSGDAAEVKRGEEFAGCKLLYDTADAEYPHLVQDCDNYRQYQFSIYNQTREEESFGIAYSILAYENTFQVERLLQVIYRPQNYFCIHVDSKADKSTYKAMESIVKCFDNVVLASHRIDVVYGLFPVLEAEMSCLKELWKFKKWKYFINLTGREFPIRTNWELVQILKAYNGSNDVLGYYKGYVCNS